MAAAELKTASIQRFERLLVFECNPSRRALIQSLLAEELQRPDSADPVDRPATIDDTPNHEARTPGSLGASSVLYVLVAVAASFVFHLLQVGQWGRL
jgi:hypothetical protein